MTTFTLANQIFQANDLITTITIASNKLFVISKLLISFFGTLTILIGAALCAYRYILFRLGNSKWTTDAIRLKLAQAILLGLEFYVAGDVIETTIAPDFSSLGVLGLLVIIRTVLNYSIGREVNNLSTVPKDN